MQGKNLVLQLGYSHDVNFPIPDDVKIACEKPTAIAITGADKQRVGQVAAEIRAYPQARALQGQGHQVRDRDDPPQGRQEEVGSAAMTGKSEQLFARRRRARAPPPRADRQGPAAALGVPLVAAHLCAGDRRRRRRAPLAAASSLDKDLRERLKTGADKAAAAAVGKLIAERAKAAGVTAVVFDRGGYLFHGRVKALADAAREGGLDF